ncbi:MAG: TOBE domain-containing protein, partial [Geminicoccaceae bacterium]|nr:TOBE domain-containing protein [Geminicoccaceae bacterium]
VYGIRPEHIEMRRDGSGIDGRVVVVEPTGAEILAVVHWAGSEVQVLFRERYPLRPDDVLNLAPKLDHVHLFDKETGKRI